MKTIDDNTFLHLKTKIELHARVSGHYIIDLVSILPLKEQSPSQEEILAIVFEYWDEEPWAEPESRPTDQTWDSDYRITQADAKNRVTNVLVGGSNVGHTKNTIEPDVAAHYFEEFNSLFSEKRKYYAHMGLGHSEFVFGHGVAIVDDEKAGILWVVEND